MTGQTCTRCGTRVTRRAGPLPRETDGAHLHTGDRCAAFRAANGQGSR